MKKQIQSKVCNHCDKRKRLDQFGRYHRNPDQRDNRCKACVNARNKTWRTKNHAHFLSREAGKRKKDRTKIRAIHQTPHAKLMRKRRRDRAKKKPR